jgi:hypothetical protein
MNIDVKILNRVGNHTQHIERIIHHDKVRFILRMKGGSIHANQQIWLTTGTE